VSLITIVREAAGRIGIKAPDALAGATDYKALHLLALCNEEGAKLATGASVGVAHDWAAMTMEARFTSAATESQGAIADIAPGLRAIINDTIFDRTQRTQLDGPLSPREWQAVKTFAGTSPYPMWRIQGPQLKMWPAPVEGHDMYFEYLSCCWCTSSGGTPQPRMVNDSDLSLLPEELVIQGLVWRWKRSKNLEYAEEFRDYQTAVLGAIQRDGGKRILDMGASDLATGQLYVRPYSGLVGDTP